MKKVVYIIPGYEESYLSKRSYKKVAGIFGARGIEPVQVEIDWFYKKPMRFKDHSEQFLKQFKESKSKGEEVYLFGFSFGAIIALLNQNKVKPKAVILCSLSPYFKEDQKDFKPSWLKWWRKNYTESDYSFDKLAKNVKTKVYLLVGDCEDKEGFCLKRAKDAKKKIKNSSLTIIKNTKHNIYQKEYLAVIKKVVGKL